MAALLRVSYKDVRVRVGDRLLAYGTERVTFLAWQAPSVSKGGRPVAVCMFPRSDFVPVHVPVGDVFLAADDGQAEGRMP